MDDDIQGVITPDVIAAYCIIDRQCEIDKWSACYARIGGDIEWLPGWPYAPNGHVLRNIALVIKDERRPHGIGIRGNNEEDQ